MSALSCELSIVSHLKWSSSGTVGERVKARLPFKEEFKTRSCEQIQIGSRCAVETLSQTNLVFAVELIRKLMQIIISRLFLIGQKCSAALFQPQNPPLSP